MKSGYPLWGVFARGAVAAGIATVINVIVASALAVTVDGSPEFLPLQPGPVITITVATIAAGTVTFALLNWLTTKAFVVFTVIASLVAVASIASPLALSVDDSGTFAGVTAAAALALVPLHIIPAATIIAAFAWRRPGVTS